MAALKPTIVLIKHLAQQAHMLHLAQLFALIVWLAMNAFLAPQFQPSAMMVTTASKAQLMVASSAKIMKHASHNLKSQ